jgi:hypothetical protein
MTVLVTGPGLGFSSWAAKRSFTNYSEIGFPEELWLLIGLRQGSMIYLLHELEGRSRDVC